VIDGAAIVAQARLLAGVDAAEVGLLERVHALVHWINGLGALNPLEVAAGEAQIRQLLLNRLRLADDRARLPGISRERIERPIFVVGMGRTGTSLLHSLLALDADVAAPVWWQTVSPSPPPGEVPVSPVRLRYAAAELDTILLRAAGLLALHPYWDKRDQAIVEDEEIFALDFRAAYPTKLYNIPTLTPNITPPDPAGAYAFLRTFLQHFQWNRPIRRWVCKGVMHQFALRHLFEAFPDAICIWPHRDPAETLASMLVILMALYGMIGNWRISAQETAASQFEGYREALNRIIDDPMAADPRVHHVSFRRLSADPVATVRDFYTAHNLPFTTTYEAALRGWLGDSQNSSNRYGRVRSSLENFGLNTAQVRAAFEPYRRRFGI
jgi:hypothetical protein